MFTQINNITLISHLSEEVHKICPELDNKLRVKENPEKSIPPPFPPQAHDLT
jgi:hypothetical protein